MWFPLVSYLSHFGSSYFTLFSPYYVHLVLFISGRQGASTIGSGEGCGGVGWRMSAVVSPIATGMIEGYLVTGNTFFFLSTKVYIEPVFP